jgi:hypothetical protein
LSSQLTTGAHPRLFALISPVGRSCPKQPRAQS